MTTKSSTKQSKISRYIKAPIRALIKARDFYINSMSDCAGSVGYGSAMGCPTPHVVSNLPKSFSVNSSKSSTNDDDFRELVRAASTRRLGNKIESEIRRQQSPTNGVPKVVPRSQSVAIGRIDEDGPCDFGEDIKVKPDVYPRSRSYAVSKRSGML